MFKNRSFNVKMVKDEEPDKTTPPPKDPWFEVRMMVEEQAPGLLAMLILYRVTCTVCQAAEHIIVTKVK